MGVANKYFLCSPCFWLESTGLFEKRYLLICKFCLCWASACLLSDPGVLYLGPLNVGVGVCGGAIPAGCFQALLSADLHLGLANERHGQEITGRAKGKSQGISLPSLSLCVSLSLPGLHSQWLHLPWFQILPGNPGHGAPVTWAPILRSPHHPLLVFLALSSPGEPIPCIKFPLF